MKKYLMKIKWRPIVYLLLVAVLFCMIDSRMHWVSNRVYTLANIQEKSVILLHKKRSQEHVFGFYVHITGELDGKARITLSQDSGKGSLHRESIISDNVDLTWGGDWYADEMYINYVPLGEIKKGALKIEYDFLD